MEHWMNSSDERLDPCLDANSLVDSAAGRFSEAELHFIELISLFLSIQAASTDYPWAAHLAALGARLCEGFADEYGEAKDLYNANVSRPFQQRRMDGPANDR